MSLGAHQRMARAYQLPAQIVEAARIETAAHTPERPTSQDRKKQPTPCMLVRRETTWAVDFARCSSRMMWRTAVMDRFFTSIVLFRALLEKGMCAIGTAPFNRVKRTRPFSPDSVRTRNSVH